MNFKHIISSILLVLSFSSIGQSENLKLKDLSNEWKLIHEENGVQFLVKSQECSFTGNKLPFVYSMLKIENSTDQSKKVTYNYVHYFQEGCDGCDANSEKTFTFEVAPNSSIEGDCDTKFAGLSSYIDNPNFDGGWHFESVQLLFLTVE